MELTREADDLSYANWSGWFAVIRKAPDRAVAAEQYAGLVRADQHARHAVGTDTHAERIAYRNGVTALPAEDGR